MKKMLALGVLAMALFLTVPAQAQNWNGPWGHQNYRQHGQCGQGYGGQHNGWGYHQAPRWGHENRHHDWQRGQLAPAAGAPGLESTLPALLSITGGPQ